MLLIGGGTDLARFVFSCGVDRVLKLVLVSMVVGVSGFVVLLVLSTKEGKDVVMIVKESVKELLAFFVVVVESEVVACWESAMLDDEDFAVS